MVVAAEAIEARLLGTLVALRWSRGFRLYGAVQALVRPVVLRPSWYDAVLADTECDPPHRELAEATAGGSGTRGAMVGADRRQQAVRMQRRSKLGLASTGLVESRAAPLRRNRLEASATVQG
jgi:hypothetical protein